MVKRYQKLCWWTTYLSHTWRIIYKKKSTPKNRNSIFTGNSNSNFLNCFIQNSQKCCPYVDAPRNHYTKWKLLSHKTPFTQKGKWTVCKRTKGKPPGVMEMVCFFHVCACVCDRNVLLCDGDVLYFGQLNLLVIAPWTVHLILLNVNNSLVDY